MNKSLGFLTRCSISFSFHICSSYSSGLFPGGMGQREIVL